WFACPRHRFDRGTTLTGIVSVRVQLFARPILVRCLYCSLYSTHIVHWPLAAATAFVVPCLPNLLVTVCRLRFCAHLAQCRQTLPCSWSNTPGPDRPGLLYSHSCVRCHVCCGDNSIGALLPIYMNFLIVHLACRVSVMAGDGVTCRSLSPPGMS